MSDVPVHLHDPADPDESDLDGVPRAFVHSRCGGKTRLNAPSVRRYLRDPLRLMGVGASVWCASCRKNVRSADCRWVETGEGVRPYFRRLIGRAVSESPWGWAWRFLLLYGAVGLLGVGGAALAYWHKGGDADTARLIALVGLAFVAAFLLVAFPVRLLAYRRCVEEYDVWRDAQT